MHCLKSNAQCTYLAYDGFENIPNTSLHGYSGGTGWAQPWFVQNNIATIPGYQTSNNSLQYNDLQTIANSGSGGNSYLMMGRRLNSNANGAFQNYVAPFQNTIGSLLGDTLWCSFMLQKSNNNNEEIFVDLHNDNISWCNNCASQHIGIGYYGSSFHIGGQRHWHLRLNDSFYDTGVEIDIDSNYLIVLRLIFDTGATHVSSFINPNNLGTQIPTAFTITNSTTNENQIRSFATYLGSSAGNGSIDEIRFASSYECVTPDDSVTVNLPPTSIFTTSTNTGQIPVTIGFFGSNSTDPEAQSLTYTWNFGDGTPAITSTDTIYHTFHTLGELITSLTVTDNLGLQHTSYNNITLLNNNNTFPCQTTITPLSRVSCGLSNGSIRINASTNTFSLYNDSNTILSVTNGNEYHNLAHGIYKLYVAGLSSSCTDTVTVHVKTDSTTCVGWQAPSCAMDIGTNLSGLNDWSVERPLKNLFKHIRNEVIGYSDTCYCWSSNVANELSLDSNGYPTHAPQLTSAGNTYLRYIISSDGGNFKMDSSYVLLYDGIGNIQLQGNVTIDSLATTRIAFTVHDNGNYAMSITYSDSNNPIKNIRIVRPQDEFADLDNNPFYIGFKNKITPFQTLRFMDWQNTNGSTNIEWSNRAKKDFFTYSGTKGVPYETIIKLANELNKDVWICSPHEADSNYIAQMATLFRDSLNSNLNVYLEYSNEVWNWIFAQAHYNNDNRPSNLSYGRAMAEKAGNTFRIWHNVWSGEKCRVKRVLGIQVGFNSLNEEILSQLPQNEWDYGSPTHYFGLDHSNNGNPNLNTLGATATVQDIMNNAINTWNAFRPAVIQDYNLIKLYGKKIATYEGGQHFVGNVFGIPYPYQQAMWDAQNDSLMYNVYNRMHDSIKNWGCELAVNFSLASPQQSVYGSWGVLSDIDQLPPYSLTAKKYQAVIENALSQNCREQNVWTGTVSNLWSDVCNWKNTKLPNSTTDVIIPAGTPFSPQVNINTTINTLRVNSNASIQVNTGIDFQIVEQ